MMLQGACGKDQGHGRPRHPAAAPPEFPSGRLRAVRAPAGDGRRGPAAGLRRRHAERRRRLGRSGRRQRRPQRGVRDLALRTLAEAWRRVPAGTALSQGVRINLAAGTYPESALPAYWENRRGTFAAPVIVRAADGPGTARLPTVNVFDCHHLRFEGLEISAAARCTFQPAFTCALTQAKYRILSRQFAHSTSRRVVSRRGLEETGRLRISSWRSRIEQFRNTTVTMETTADQGLSATFGRNKRFFSTGRPSGTQVQSLLCK